MEQVIPCSTVTNSLPCCWVVILHIIIPGSSPKKRLSSGLFVGESGMLGLKSLPFANAPIFRLRSLPSRVA